MGSFVGGQMHLIGEMGAGLSHGRQENIYNYGQGLCRPWWQAMVKLPLVKKKEDHIDEFVCLGGKGSLIGKQLCQVCVSFFDLSSCNVTRS